MERTKSEHQYQKAAIFFISRPTSPPKVPNILMQKQRRKTKF